MHAIIFIGIQGSGKTTFYRQHFFDTHLRISLDMVKTRRRERLLMDACIAAGQRFVIDNTNVLQSERAAYISLARAGGFYIEGYFFVPQVERALAWNQQRSGKAVVPVKGLLGTLKRLQRPVIEEGFDRLHDVVIDPEGNFIIESRGLQ